MAHNLLYYLSSILGVNAALRHVKGKAATVLSLHRIAPYQDCFFDPIHPERLDNLLRYFSRHYTITTLNHLSIPSLKPKLVLSFDDGYYDFVEYAMPILHKHKVPCNHNFVNICLSNNEVIWTQIINDILAYSKNRGYVVSELEQIAGPKAQMPWSKYKSRLMRILFAMDLSTRKELVDSLKLCYPEALNPYRMMNWDDVRSVMSDGVEPGTHTYSHSSLLNITRQDELEAEIGAAKNEMEQQLNREINIIAFPNGQHNEQVINYCASIGLDTMLLVRDATVPASLVNDTIKKIPRINMINEPLNTMILRSELFHAKIRKIRG